MKKKKQLAKCPEATCDPNRILSWWSAEGE